MDLVGPIAEYKVYVKGEVDTLVNETRKLTDAVKAGKLAEAQKAYAPAPPDTSKGQGCFERVL